MRIDNIITDRLVIIPMTYSIVCSLLNGDNKELEKLGVNLNGKWPLQDTLDILNFLKDGMKKNDEVDGFGVWMIVKKDDMTVIGDAGFKGKPDENGEIEIGFGLIEEEWRKGYGCEAASSLIKWASENDLVKAVIAECLIDNIASIKTLKKCSMCEVKRDNELIYWKKSVI